MLCVTQRAQSMQAIAASNAAAFLTVDGRNVTVTYATSTSVNGTGAPLTITNSTGCTALPTLHHQLSLCNTMSLVAPRDAGILANEAPHIDVGMRHINAPAL